MALQDLTGALFCGGRSRRMGDLGDKAQLRVGDETLLERGAQVLAEVAGEVVLACGSRERYGELGLELVLDDVEDAGPLAGLVAVLEHVGRGRVAVLACDMPRADASAFGLLLEQAIAEDLDICLLESEGGVEPLFGIYHTRCAPVIRQALLAGERKLVSIHDGLRVGTVPASHFEGRDIARNLNEPRDFAHERGELEDEGRIG